MRRPLKRTVSPPAIRSPRTPDSGGPSNTSTIATSGGMAAAQPPDDGRRRLAVAGLAVPPGPSSGRGAGSCRRRGASSCRRAGRGGEGGSRGKRSALDFLARNRDCFGSCAQPQWLRLTAITSESGLARRVWAEVTGYDLGSMSLLSARRPRRRRLPRRGAGARRRRGPGRPAPRCGDDVVYVTNNSMWYRAEYVDSPGRRWARRSTTDRIVSSPRATALYLRDHEPDVRRVLAVGAGGLERELRDAGFEVTTAGHAGDAPSGGTASSRGRRPAHPDAVVVGLDPQLTYLRLAVAADCIRAGARFIATNRDPVYPTERGLRPGAGSRRRGDRGDDRRHAGLDRQAGAVPARGGGAGGRPRAGRGGDDRRRARRPTSRRPGRSGPAAS